MKSFLAMRHTHVGIADRAKALAVLKTAFKNEGVVIGKMICIKVDRITRGIVNQGRIGTNQEGKKANRPPWGTIGLLAGVGGSLLCQCSPTGQ